MGRCVELHFINKLKTNRIVWDGNYLKFVRLNDYAVGGGLEPPTV